MLPPILEIYVLWHPKDAEAEQLAKTIAEHFHGNSYSGLLDGAVEVYIRSAGWLSADGPPRPISLPNTTTERVAPAKFVAIVPCIGVNMAKSVQPEGAWRDYLQTLIEAHHNPSSGVRIFPQRINNFNSANGWLSQHIDSIQGLAAANQNAEHKEIPTSMMCRDLAQGLAQWLGAQPRLKVFISHTKRSGIAEEKLGELIEQTRTLISNTRLATFFDAQDLQPSNGWSKDLIENAQTCALLAIRSDLYATRVWCQREMLTAKRYDMPVVILNVLQRREERGSFLMDHVARISIRQNLQTETEVWRNEDILSALNLLVDVCLQRVLWHKQAQYANEYLAKIKFTVDWWAAHAPEPATLSHWLTAKVQEQPDRWQDGLTILHPDPPLGQDEIHVLEQIARLAGVKGVLELTTPRMLAARGM